MCVVGGEGGSLPYMLYTTLGINFILHAWQMLLWFLCLSLLDCPEEVTLCDRRDVKIQELTNRLCLKLAIMPVLRVLSCYNVRQKHSCFLLNDCNLIPGKSWRACNLIPGKSWRAHPGRCNLNDELFSFDKADLFGGSGLVKMRGRSPSFRALHPACRPSSCSAIKTNQTEVKLITLPLRCL